MSTSSTVAYVVSRITVSTLLTTRSSTCAVVAVGFALTPAFGAVYLIVALVTAAGLVVVTWRFSTAPSPDTAWAGYKYSSMYLGILLVGVIVDALLRTRP